MKIRWTFLTLPVLVGAIASPMHSASKPTPSAMADRILVFKSKREMQLLHDGKVIKSYRIALGGTPVGRKEQQGDHKTPEGSTRSSDAIRAASFIAHCVSRTRMQRIAPVQRNAASLPAATS